MKGRDIIRYPLIYICWILTTGFSLLVVLRMYGTLNLVWPALGADPFVLRGVGRFFPFIAGLAWLSYVVVTEWYYRSSINEEKEEESAAEEAGAAKSQGLLRKLGIRLLPQRFLIALSIPLALFVLEYIVRSLTLRSLRS